MKFIGLEFPGLFVIEPTVYEDERGYFFESYRHDILKHNVGEIELVQDNESKSAYGVIRGLHYQIPPFEQTKLLKVVFGEIKDVVIDLRKKSPTFGQVFSVILSEKNKRQIYIPAGFGHGFSVLSPYAVVQYKVDKFYSKEHERGIIYNDPSLEIDWQIAPENAILSEKDLKLPLFENAEYFYDDLQTK